MKITKRMLKRIIKEEIEDHNISEHVSTMTHDSMAGIEDDAGPDMSTGPKLDRIIAILEKAFPGV